MTTTKEKGKQYSLYVTDIKPAYKITKANKFVHLITFKEKEAIYIAEEVEDQAMSKFLLNKRNVFEVTNPGKGGYPDWIRFVAINTMQPNGDGTFEPLPVSRDDMAISQTAFNKACELGIKHGWTNDQIIDNAYMFAGNIKLIAKHLAAEIL